MHVPIRLGGEEAETDQEHLDENGCREQPGNNHVEHPYPFTDHVVSPSFNLTLAVAPGLRWNTARIGPWDAQFTQLCKVSTSNNRTGIRATTHLEPSVRSCYVKPGD